MTSPDTRPTPDEAALRQFLDHWLAAVRRKDLDTIMAAYASQVRAFDAIYQLQFQGRDAYGQHWAHCLEHCAGDMEMTLHDARLHVSGNMAFCHAICECGGTDQNGERHTGFMRMTTCLERHNGKWQIVHDHFSAPFDPLTNKIIDNLKP